MQSPVLEFEPQGPYIIFVDSSLPSHRNKRRHPRNREKLPQQQVIFGAAQAVGWGFADFTNTVFGQGWISGRHR
jgi:hypothetical protein